MLAWITCFYVSVLSANLCMPLSRVGIIKYVHTYVVGEHLLHIYIDRLQMDAF